jgi:hypothetical protein
VEETTFCSRQNVCTIFGIICYHIYNTVEVIAIDVTYLQYKNIHMIFVIGINRRTDVMARPKSSQCMYTSTNIPVYVLQLHIITVIMYTAYIVDNFFIFNGTPAILNRNIIELKRLSDSPLCFGSCLFMLK